mmetsp:Transcript_17588/g.31736  ORF Transcript_17588/g.31736 Transcript_17588/m.31736 type:complete len:321 (-) Transcript_17588:132-1094(-)
MQRRIQLGIPNQVIGFWWFGRDDGSGPLQIGKATLFLFPLAHVFAVLDVLSEFAHGSVVAGEHTGDTSHQKRDTLAGVRLQSFGAHDRRFASFHRLAEFVDVTSGIVEVPLHVQDTGVSAIQFGIHIVLFLGQHGDLFVHDLFDLQNSIGQKFGTLGEEFACDGHDFLHGFWKGVRQEDESHPTGSRSNGVGRNGSQVSRLFGGRSRLNDNGSGRGCRCCYGALFIRRTDAFGKLSRKVAPFTGLTQRREDETFGLFWKGVDGSQRNGKPLSALSSQNERERAFGCTCCGHVPSFCELIIYNKKLSFGEVTLRSKTNQGN